MAEQEEGSDVERCERWFPREFIPVGGAGQSGVRAREDVLAGEWTTGGIVYNM